MKSIVLIVLLLLAATMLFLCGVVTAMDMSKGGSPITGVCIPMMITMCIVIVRAPYYVGIER